ncbi:hypothetical protein [Kitasatospora aureofaciens]|nr:hypothetical protein [Kitasatospora aureofaciens]MBV6701028.1 hypothetical protein [Kitasatospora aureofaciens]
MHFFLGAGFRGLMNALINGDPLWPAVTLFLVSILITIVIAAVRASRG